MSDVNRFEELVLPHLDAAHNLARWLTRNPDDAEDVVQEACVRALKYIGALHGDEARAWFLTIVRHAFYDWCKRNRPAEIARDDGTAIEMAIDDAAIDPEQAALRGVESRLQHTIDIFVRPKSSHRLPPALRTVRGFNVAHATGTGMDWIAVSDVSADVLSPFIQRLAHPDAAP